jgi:hypothetical protein
VSLDAPLVELGAITDERVLNGRARSWRERVAPGTALFAYLFNNYWHTNYKADQSGPLSFRFVIAPHAAFDPVALRRLSDEHDFPLLAVTAREGTPAVTAPFLLEGDPVLVASLRRAETGDALDIRLYNPAPRPATVTLRTTRDGAGIAQAGETHVRAAPALTLTMPPLASRMVTIASR